MKVPQTFRIFVPNFARNFAPNFPHIFRGLLCFILWETETTKTHELQKLLRHLDVSTSMFRGNSADFLAISVRKPENLSKKLHE